MFLCDKQDFLHYTRAATSNGRRSQVTEHKVHTVELVADHGTKLFPTVVITPSTDTLMTLDFTPHEDCRPLSSTFISSTSHRDSVGSTESSTIPLCPRRLDLMVHSKSYWVRQAPESPKYTTGCMTGGGGALTVTTDKEVEQTISITLPQEDIVMNILEISEDLKLMDFHVQTLDTFCAVCSHSNLSLARSIMTFIDSEQLLKCLQVSNVVHGAQCQGAMLGWCRCATP